MMLVYLVAIIVLDVALIYTIDFLIPISQSSKKLSDWVDLEELMKNLQIVLVFVLPPAYFWRHRFGVAKWIFNSVWRSATTVFFWGLMLSALLSIKILCS